MLTGIRADIVEGMFGGPPLLSKPGRFIWTGASLLPSPLLPLPSPTDSALPRPSLLAMVFLYWSLAFIVGAAIPQVQTISGLVAAICIMQFTYTFPPALIFGFYFLKDRRDAATGAISWSRVRNPPSPLLPSNRLPVCAGRIRMAD